MSQLLPLLTETSAFGNPTRLDYGTGHELAFGLFLFALRVRGLLQEDDDELVVLGVFKRYVKNL
jgi:serine/threonine-protein phosphatase 2A activator